MGRRKELVVLIHLPYRLTKYDAIPGHRRTEGIPDYLVYCLILHLLVTLDHFEPRMESNTASYIRRRFSVADDFQVKGITLEYHNCLDVFLL
jgi:hypothetical protein